jgi:glycosyltransferase involved in cell wall biosynthesis
MQKRVVFLNRFYWPDESATAQILTDLAEHLAAKGWEVDVVTSRLLYSGEKDKLPVREKVNGVCITRLWSTRFGRANLAGRFLDYLSVYFSYLVHLVLRTRPGDIVVAKTDPPLMSVPCWMGKTLRGYQLVSWCQDIFPEILAHRSSGFPISLVVPALTGLRNLSLNGSDTVAVLSEDMRGFLQNEGIRSPKRILPNWAISETEPTDHEVLNLRREWGLENRFVLGYSGNLGRVHDWKTLYASLDALADIEGLTILLVGGGAGYEALRSACTSNGSPDIRFLPYQPRERLGACLRVPDVHWLSLLPEMSPLVFPSKFYGILSAGRPCLFVGDPRTELGDVIERDGCGFSVKSGDSRRFAESVHQLALDPDLRERMGRRASELSRTVFSPEALKGRWAMELESLRRDSD